MSDPAIVTPTIVIGAGPAGLAVGACLKQEGIACLILEESDRVASSWRRHYDRLHLHTDKKNSELPLVPFPKEYPKYPSRPQVISYLESYADQSHLDIRFRQRVMSVRYDDDQWEIRTEDTLYRSSNLVIATGYNREPYLPTWPGQNTFGGLVMHSSEYRNGEPFRGKRVLVVGFGNSGGEIAIDLWEHGAEVALAVRGPINVIPRELFGIPIVRIAILQSKLPASLADAINALILRAAIGDLTKYGLRKLHYGPISQMRRDARIPLIDVGTVKLIKTHQVKVHPGIKEFTDSGVIFADGKQEPFDAVLLATGYRPRVNTFLTGMAAAACDGNGIPLSSGRQAGMPGLYFCGYFVSGTGILREIGIEATKISALIAENQAARKPG